MIQHSFYTQVKFDEFQVETDVTATASKDKQELYEELQRLDSEIEDLTNHADNLDYMVAAAAGLLSGLVDSFFVGEFSLNRASKWGEQKVQDFVMKISESQGYKGDDLTEAVRHLEQKFPIAADKATADFGGGLQHHLRDFSHHPTIVGWAFSMLTQFTAKVYGTDRSGVFKIVKLPADIDKDKYIGKDLPHKFLYGTIYWFFHMVSDIAGSSSTLLDGKRGTGLPGPFLSLLKELSALPIFKTFNENGDKMLSVWLSKLFNGTKFSYLDENGKKIARQFDLRTEIGVLKELEKQAIPVLLNECIVRGFYFIRRFAAEIKSSHVHSFEDLKELDYEKMLPFNNRTIVRMLTIASGTFVAVDCTDAAIRSAVKSWGNSALFVKGFFVRVNIVGVGRFAIACTFDVKMGVERRIDVRKREKVYNAIYHNTAVKTIRDYGREGTQKLTAFCKKVVEKVFTRSVTLTISYREARKMRGFELTDKLQTMGFRNICICISYNAGWFTKDGKIKSITIGNDRKFKADTEYRSDTPIYITYRRKKKYAE